MRGYHDDCKKMKWLMTGGNNGTIDMCGENISLNCDDICYQYDRMTNEIARSWSFS